MLEVASRALFEEQLGLWKPELLQHRQWALLKKEYPILDLTFSCAGRKTLRLRLTCDNWNDQPPAIELLEVDGNHIQVPLQSSTGVFNPGPHDITKRPFICMRGSREYHTHPGHVNDAWANIRALPNYDLGSIVTQLWNAWKKATP